MIQRRRRITDSFTSNGIRSLLSLASTKANHAIAHSCTIFPYYLGMEINQCRDPLNNNKDCQVVFSVLFEGADPQIGIQNTKIIIAGSSTSSPWCTIALYCSGKVDSSFIITTPPPPCPPCDHHLQARFTKVLRKPNYLNKKQKCN